MIEIPGPIPIRIHPLFWALCALIGWMYSATLAGMFIWIGIIFVSVLIHEFGHALTAVLFRQKANIQLVVLGGLTSYEGPKLKYWQQFFIVLNGPLFGFFLFLLATYILTLPLSPLWHAIFKSTQVANLFWTIVNLFPVMPLDGGQLLRIVLEALFGLPGLRASLFLGMLLSILLSFYFFIVQAFLVGAIFFLFAFQSFDSWRRSRLATTGDREDENRKLFIQAEEALQLGKRDEAKKLFEEVKSKAKGGVLAAAAAQYLAQLLSAEGNHKEAYELLLSIEKHLASDSKCLLHQLAAEMGNDTLVARLSTECYQIAPSREMALTNARSFARLHQARLAGGWLQTAWQFGGLNLETLLKEECFTALKGAREFEEFVEKLK